MAKSKIRNKKKKHVPGKRAAESWLQGLVLESWDSMDYGPDGSPTYKSNRPYSIVEKAVFSARRWYFAAIVKCRADDGDLYEERIEVITEHSILLNDLRDHALQMVEDVKQGVNQKHIYDSGWEARPLTPKLQAILAAEAALAARG